MGRILVFQHVAWEILGTLNPILKQAGHRIRYINFARTPDAIPDVSSYDALIILGGPMNVDETHLYPHLKTECHLIEKAIKLNKPVLGICLGAQLIAKSLGAKVFRNKKKEIGWTTIKKLGAARHFSGFHDFKPCEDVFQWHGDTFELPQGAHHLASSELCENQAFLYGKNVLGLQFHLEVDQRMINRWLHVPSMREEFLKNSPDTCIENFLIESKKLVPRLTQLSHKLFKEFIKHLGEQQTKKIRLHSR